LTPLAQAQPHPGSAASACWICGGPAHEVAEYRPLHYGRCSSCGFLFQPEISVTELRAQHGQEYFATRYPANDAQRRAEARRRLRWLRSHGVSAGRLLEVGVAQGHFLDEAHRAGFDPSGIEPEPGTAQEARERSGVEVVGGYVEEVDLPAEGVDVICMWHVLEHVPRPLDALRRLRDSLAPGGHLFCEVPNGGSVRARAEGIDWLYLDPEHHVNLFAPETLRSALEAAGFEVRETVTIPMIRYARLGPRLPVKLARHLRFASRNRVPFNLSDPSRHELLRAVARVPA
jgi:2-polyprenyl-3-methyl-5-hydroxy-6-metoxy-1,4-benzoquinol methylase